MGVSEARMRKLMEGRGPGRPGVAGKVGALVETIRDGAWCAEQGSLMRALAYGILDPDGERYRLALMHHSQCSACRAYVASLRGLAATLPPVVLPWGLGAAVLARAGEGLHAGAARWAAPAVGGSAAGRPAAAAAGSGASAGVQAGRGLGGALSASGAAAGAGGAAGGGWLLGAGPLGAKLAVGCLLALGVGAGCVALDGGQHAREPRHGRHHRGPADGASATHGGRRSAGRSGGGVGQPLSAATRGNAGSATPLTPSARASREFGPEQALAPGARRRASRGLAPAPDASVARSAVQSRREASPARRAGGRICARHRSSSGDAAAAEREFSPG